MIINSIADISSWIGRGWREIDRKSPEGKAACEKLGSSRNKTVQRYLRAFKRGRVPILVGTAQMAEAARAIKEGREPEVYSLGADEPSYLIPYGKSLLIIERF